MTHLTVKLVEEIHEAIDIGAPVEAAIAGIQSATLPAILEYGCLRWARPDSVPPLPQSVIESQLGETLMQVRSVLGLRSSGAPKAPLRRIDIRPCEFHVIEDPTAFPDAQFEQFEVRFDRSAQSVGFPPRLAHGLHGAMHEMCENAAIHSKAPTGILIGYSVEQRMAMFSVVDVGIGVLASLRSHPAYANISLHKDAIRAALQEGTSRFGPNTRGLGFRQIFKALAEQWGHLRFRSGSGCITLNGHGLDEHRGEESFPPDLPGFQVTVCCRTSPPQGPSDLF